MSKYLVFFREIIKKKILIVLKSPPSSPIVVFDNTSIEELRHIIDRFDHFVLEVRPQEIKKIYISPTIIYNFIFLFCFKKNKLSLVDLYFSLY